jgi:hypothetical protein
MATTFVEGRTRWKRFAVVLALSVLAAGVLLFAVAQGAIGASFAVSGSSFKISASQLQGSGFAQFASIDRTADGAHPVATTAIGSASMDDFCQSATARSIPGIGDVSLVIRAAGRDSVQASNMVIHIADLTGSRLSFHNCCWSHWLRARHWVVPPSPPRLHRWLARHRVESRTVHRPSLTAPEPPRPVPLH